ncbi:hypothetical protein AK830_g2802 [Neonectria ditissima]|uniref:F-box domain-containing protein n=1 Tax=Neonectria ditissima TaxID=78410 RepID=A0A0P7BE10_9HYPO|nr:hypothetical protein AK830_g2802 [Neonectria ditissima]
MVSPLVSSPTDVLHQIITYLPRRTLYNLCLASTALRSVAEPFLYSSIQWTWTESQTPPILSLLRSILRRPELATFTQHFALKGAAYEYDLDQIRGESPKISPADDDLDAIIQCMQRIDVPYRDLWMEEICTGTMDAFVALLLSRLPRLRSLYLGENSTKESCLVGMMFASALCDKSSNSLPSYEYLKGVETAHLPPGVNIRARTDFEDREDVLPFLLLPWVYSPSMDVLSLFYLPSVERITAVVDNTATFAWPAKHPPSPLRLTALNLSVIREANLGQVLSTTAHLQKLEWNWFYVADLEDSFLTETIDLDQTAAAFSHVRNTLTDLTISARSGSRRARPDFLPLRVAGKSTAFSHLRVLKSLSVPLPFLLGFSPDGADTKLLRDVLPPNLEFLTITDDLYLQDEWQWRDADFLQVLGLWLQDWRTSTPRLRGFRLFSKTMDYDEWGPPMRQKVKELGIQAGVPVEITKLPGKIL